MNTEEKLLKMGIGEVMRKLGPVLKPYRGWFALGVSLILVTTAIEIVSPLLIGWGVDAALDASKNERWLYIVCGTYLALVVLKSLFDSVQAYVIQGAGQRITHDLRSLLFRRIEYLPVPYFDKNPTGRLLTRVVNDIKSLSELFTASISVLALDLMIIVGTVAAMLWIHWKLASLVLVSFPIVIGTIRFFGLKLAVSYRRVRAKLAEINSFLGENIGAIATIQRLAAEEERMAKFNLIVEGHQEAQMDTLQVFAVVQPIANVINGVAMGTLMIVGGYWVMQGSIKVGIVVSFFAYLRNLFQPVRDLVEKYNTFLSAMVSAERVVSLLDEPLESEPSEVLSAGSQGEAEPYASTEVIFEQVTFRYPSRESNALENVSFRIPAGQSLAVVGATGSGKSTLIRLLLKFYEPTDGGIYFGSKSLRQWDRASLRTHIGVVHQEIYLFQGTIRENLTLGRDQFSDAHLIEKCQRVQLWDFIRNRGGLDMQVYEGGSNFSIGERQLLSFARILVFDTPVLVLDEATSSVDRRLERRLMEAIHEVLSCRTSIVIAHRLSTIEECNDIIVLEKGKLVQQGGYDALLRQAGLFQNFHAIHSRG
jgi:ATP-binding cassette, subfamily B, multidrug efflux pump